MSRFPAKYERDPGGGYVVTFRDIPEAVTQGDTLEEARTLAVDALVTAMDFYFEDQRSVPVPSKLQNDEEFVELPLSLAAKVLLLNEMVEKKARPGDLAKAMKVTPQEVSRILDLSHTTKIDTIERAFHALGRHLELKVA